MCPESFAVFRVDLGPLLRGQMWFFIIILGSYIVLFLLLAQSALYSITPARIASLGNLTYCCHARRRRQYPLKLGTHISPGWREA